MQGLSEGNGAGNYMVKQLSAWPTHFSACLFLCTATRKSVATPSVKQGPSHINIHLFDLYLHQQPEFMQQNITNINQL